MSVQTVVARYLRDLRATLSTNVDVARRMLALAAEKEDRATVRREALIAQITGNLAGMFALEPELRASVGAGSPAHTPASESLVA